MTRRQLREIAREKRAREPENEASENQAAERNPGFLSAEEDGLEGGGSRPGPDAGEEIVAWIGGQVRGIVAQLPDRPDRVLGFVQEDLRGLENRLAGYPGNTVRMQEKFERLREMRERGASRTRFGTFRSAAITLEIKTITAIAPLRSSSNASGGSPRETAASPWQTPEPSPTDSRRCAARRTAPAEPVGNDGRGPGTPCGQTVDRSKRETPERPRAPARKPQQPPPCPTCPSLPQLPRHPVILTVVVILVTEFASPPPGLALVVRLWGLEGLRQHPHAPRGPCFADAHVDGTGPGSDPPQPRLP